MLFEFDDLSVILPARQWLTLANARGRSIRVKRGQVWITQDGDIRDYVQVPGQSFVILHTGVVTISAYSEAELEIKPAT